MQLHCICIINVLIVHVMGNPKYSLLVQDRNESFPEIVVCNNRLGFDCVTFPHTQVIDICIRLSNAIVLAKNGTFKGYLTSSSDSVPKFTNQYFLD